MLAPRMSWTTEVAICSSHRCLFGVAVSAGRTAPPHVRRPAPDPLRTAAGVQKRRSYAFQEIQRCDVPAELILNPRAAALTHLGALRGIVHQSRDGLREFHLVVGGT